MLSNEFKEALYIGPVVLNTTLVFFRKCETLTIGGRGHPGAMQQIEANSTSESK